MSSEKIQIGSGDHQSLFKTLENADLYPHHPENVEHIQTHISHVYIAPPYVYKFKKPVDFGFVDYKTLKKRKHFCEREIELNRRLCSDIYLGVIPISDASGNVIEYAVKMKQLDEQYFLDSYINNDTLTHQHLDRVADVLIDFYRNQDPGQEILRYGEIENIRYNTNENFQQTQSYVGETITEESYQAIQYFTDRYFEKKELLFKRRIDEKKIVDGHGDLHLEHIHVKPDTICIYDCIEFNERFRYGDLAADLAFLIMDLDFRERWKEGRHLLEQISEKLGDKDLTQIIDFYKCYRAYVKGKVKSMQSAEEEVSEEDRREAHKRAEKYFHLSLRYALLGSVPTVLIFMGRIATGKSTLANHFETTLNIECFSSDRVRKKLAGIPFYKRVSKPEREKLYSPEMSEKTYLRLIDKAFKKLENGQSVILDATFSKRSDRQELIQKLEDKNINYYFIETRASDTTINSRLKARGNSDDSFISDARLEDFEKLDTRYESPDELPDQSIIKVSTETQFKSTIDELYKKLIDRRVLE